MPEAAAQPSDAGAEPVLDVHDIQGNILAGFKKDYQRLIAVNLRDVSSARKWIRRVAPEISSTAEVLQFNALFRMRRARLGHDPLGLVATWVNIAFSHRGLSVLTSAADADAVTGENHSFQEGMPERASILGDPPAAGEIDPTKHWVIGGTGNIPDVLLIVASDDLGRLKAIAKRIRPGKEDGARLPKVLWEEDGRTRDDLPGHEHFGFKDGVSQPGVRGRISEQADSVLTPRMLRPPAAGQMEFAAPGQPLVWPGQFVFGYPATDQDTGGPVAPPKLGRDWLRNGSFLVFRRLQQDVAGFTNFLKDESERMAATGKVPGITSKRLGAMLVGRWPSGAPISRAPLADDPDLADAGREANDFLFTMDTPAPDFNDGARSEKSFPRAVEDTFGFVCPCAAHIRKVNPRDQHSNFGPQFNTLTRRILRRGIPYGPPARDPLVDDGSDRGLHFLCYLTDIEAQFEDIQRDWANSTANPAPGGHDVVIALTPDGKRTATLVFADGNEHRIETPRQWVVATGGGYFFAPSISAIRDVLGGEEAIA
jgi:Dyp-type peroxidase family